MGVYYPQPGIQNGNSDVVVPLGTEERFIYMSSPLTTLDPNAAIETCTIKVLTQDQWLPSASRAIEINPANAPAKVLGQRWRPAHRQLPRQPTERSSRADSEPYERLECYG